MVLALLVDSSLTPSMCILLGASALTIVLSIFFFHKSRVLRQEMVGKMTITVFNKTFNVFDVFPHSSKVILNYAVPLFGLAVWGTVVVAAIVVGKVMEMGLILSPVVFIICLASVAIAEAFEVRSTADSFIAALKAGKPLGKGDIVALLTVDNMLPRISLYYLLVAILLGAIGLTLPFTFIPALYAIGGVFGGIVQVTVNAGYPTFYLAPFSVAAAAFVVMLIGGKVKRKLLNLSSAVDTNLNTSRYTPDYNRYFLMPLYNHMTAWGDEHEPKDFQRKEPKDDK